MPLRAGIECMVDIPHLYPRIQAQHLVPKSISDVMHGLILEFHRPVTSQTYCSTLRIAIIQNNSNSITSYKAFNFDQELIILH